MSFRAVLLALICVLLGCSGVLGATPRCPEDGKAYSTGPSVAVQQALTVPAGTANCSAGYTGAVVIDTNVGVVVFTQGISYMYAPPQNASVATFTLGVQCNGATVCTASIVVNVVAPTVAPTPSPPTTTAAPTTPTPLPSCPATAAITIPPSVTYYGQVTAPSSTCAVAYSAKITQAPSQGAVVFSGNQLQYIVAPPSTNAMLSFQYTIQCNQVDVCTGSQSISVYAPTTPAPPIARCPTDQILMIVAPSQQVSNILDVGTTCSNPTGYIVNQPSIGLFTFTQGLRYMFTAPPAESNVLVDVEVRCDSVPFCRASVGFLVTIQTTIPPTTTVAPTTTTPPPTPAPTPVPATPAPPPSMCNLPAPIFYRVAVGTQFQGALNVSLPSCTNVVTYRMVPAASSLNGQFVVNLVGSYIYAPPNAEVADVVAIDVGCVNSIQCRTTVTFTTYFPITPVPTTTTAAPTTAPTAVPLPSCANVYYYSVRTSKSLSNSLSGMPGENACAYGRSFSIIRQVQQGTLVLTSSGDFTYAAPAREGYFDFGFRMICMGSAVCEGSAYLQVSNAVTPAPVVVDTTLAPGMTTAAPTTAPPVILPNPQMTCRGTCNQNAWKSIPNKDIWDTTSGSGAVRSDGKAPNAIDVTWQNGSLVIKVYTYIGNVAVRFPTFEAFSATLGGLTPLGISSQVAASSTAFNQACLAQQVTTGMGEDVWKWVSIVNATGRVNTLYNSGDSWYQKFGGKHVNCDTFFNSCKYAPLLTPADPSQTGGTWTMDISDCDATWTGTFPASALRNLKTVQGLNIWSNGQDSRQLRGAIVTEAVRPTSWLDPNRGYDTSVTASNVILDLREHLAVRKVTQSSAYTFDSEYYEYLDANGDLAFGVNLLFYSFVPPGGSSNYGSDRHVSGFKWISQSWAAPSNNQCPTCTGAKTQCKGSTSYASSTFLGQFQNGDCPLNTARIFLSKGPALQTANCTADPVHVFGQPGISYPTNCTTNFQNLTLRGVATGSRGLTAAQRAAFTLEGTIQLQLLLDNGDKPIISLDLSLFVSRVSKGAVALTGGELGLCLASSYWPVLDPFGFSNPAQPLAISGTPAGVLCSGTFDLNFGPTGWVTMFLQLPNVKPADVTVQLIKMSFDSTTIVLLYRDPSSGLVTVPPAGAGYWWQRTHPFLNVRWLNDAIYNGTLQLDGFTPSDIPFAFTFTPGAISIDTRAELVVQATIRSQDAATGVVTTSDNTFTRRFHIDPLLTYESRNGPRPSTNGRLTIREQTKNLVIPAALIAALVVALFIAKSCSNDEPLPVAVQSMLDTANSVNPFKKGDQEEVQKTKVLFTGKPKDMFSAMHSEKGPREGESS